MVKVFVLKQMYMFLFWDSSLGVLKWWKIETLE